MEKALTHGQWWSNRSVKKKKKTMQFSGVQLDEHNKINIIIITGSKGCQNVSVGQWQATNMCI